jgi:hypothetical protein
MASPLLKGNLQPTDFADAVCKVSPWVWVDGAWDHAPWIKGYRVWVCRCSNFWFQRHEWARTDRNSTETDAWIFSGHRHNGQFPAHMIPVPEEDNL